MNSYCLGIDTGGTFTDAVLLDSVTKEVIHQTKKQTTHHDLSIGVIQALEQLLQKDITTGEIHQLAVSTTLATNTIVEGHGAKVALFVLGHVKHFKLPVVANIFFKGGHKITGEEDTPIDIEEIIDTLQGLKGQVDSYAVCGAMSIKNPTHELVTEKAISLIDPKPVFCSHRVSSHPGMLERSATACLHAKLQPQMADFLSSIEGAMQSQGLRCPVTIVCGDGTGASLKKTVGQAAVTMASGPAATARFGAFQGIEKALVVDIGGTTTDICLITDSKPVISEEGCRIGRWQTHVKAVDMYTAAGGGDSHIQCDKKGNISLGTNRVQPLSMTRDIPDPQDWLNGFTDTFLVLAKDGRGDLEETGPILNYLQRQTFATPSEIAKETGIQGIILEKKLEQLAYKQQVVITGFTPTDALHALDILAIGDKTPACAGADALADQLGLTRKEFCQSTIQAAGKTIEKIIMSYLTKRQWSQEHAASLLSEQDNDYFSMRFSLHLPIIGIGAAAKYFLPEVAKRLDTSVVFPENYEVGNAIGAALIAADS